MSQAANGALTLNPNGSFTYTPTGNFSGNDTFTYKGNDGTADSTGADSFTFKANDGAPDGNRATVNVTIALSTLTVTVVSPNGGEKLFANTPSTIRWIATGATEAGRMRPSRGCAGLPGTATSCVWTPTGRATTTALVRVTAGGRGYDDCRGRVGLRLQYCDCLAVDHRDVSHTVVN